VWHHGELAAFGETLLTKLVEYRAELLFGRLDDEP